ncbi:flavin reductase family protein [Anthocerotibacter panamensis]|uniref:flavin reductase family protein n=1 Tax=Anthocerotibacter panamensis TaxID=2857077 RepID=UPI001C40305C|nr:flavin reductase family protein [Anthocerotibacter panamensis]
MDKERLSAALGKIPSGIFIVTCGAGEQASGMLASWVQQAGFEPPALSVAVRKGRAVEPLLAEAGQPFAVHILTKAMGKTAGHFGKGFAPTEPAFEGIPTRMGKHGVPILTEALAYFECQVRGRLDAGDHWIVVGEILEGEVLAEGESWVHTRKNGFTY